MTDRELLISGLEKLHQAESLFNEINHEKAKSIMLELSKGLEVSADRLITLLQSDDLQS